MRLLGLIPLGIMAFGYLIVEIDNYGWSFSRIFALIGVICGLAYFFGLI